MNNDIKILEIAYNRIEMLLKEQGENLIKVGVLKAQNIIGEMKIELVKQKLNHELEIFKQELNQLKK